MYPVGGSDTLRVYTGMKHENEIITATNFNHYCTDRNLTLHSLKKKAKILS